MKKPTTLEESWQMFKDNCLTGRGMPKDQIAACHDMYMVGACDLGRILFGIMSDKELSGHGAAAKLKMLEAELEGFKIKLAETSLRRMVTDKNPDMREALEAIKNRSH